MTLLARLHPHRRALFALLALLVALGVHSAFTSARSIYPRVSFPRIAVIAERGDQAVRTMLISTTLRIERAVSTVPGIERVRSKTVRGASELSLDFRPDTDMAEALALVRARVGAAETPADARIVIEQQTPAVFPVISCNVVPSERDAADPVARAKVAEWAEEQLRPRLLRLPDTFLVTVQSGDQREYVFEADPAALAAAGVTIEQVEHAIADADAVTAIGRTRGEGLQNQLLLDGRLHDPAEIADVHVMRDGLPPIELGVLGNLRETTADRSVIVTGGERDSVVVSVFLRDGGRVTDLSRDVAAVLASARAEVPGGGTIVPVYDQAQLVQSGIGSVRDAIALGAILSVLVLLVFLGDLRTTLVAGISVPLSVGLTLAAFPWLGESLNLMSLGGLAVAIGLVIDDAIVVVENVARRVHEAGGATFGVVADGVQEVLGAIVGSSLTTVVVFVPLVLLDGVVGQFFQSLAVALGVSIAASLLVALVYTPLLLLSKRLLPRVGRERSFVRAWQAMYASAVGRAIRAPRKLGAGLVLALLALVLCTGRVATGFLPEIDEGGFVLDYALPVGSSLEQTDATCRRIERVLLATDEVAALSRRTGAELGFFATEQFTGDMLVALKPKRSRSVTEVIDEVRDRLAVEVPSAEIEFVQVMQDTINDLAGNPEPIEVKVLGIDYAALQQTADRVEAALEGVPGIVDVTNHKSFGSPELVVRPDPPRVATAGLTPGGLAEQVRAQLLGTVVTQVQEGERLVDLRVRYPQRWRADDAFGERMPALFALRGKGLPPVPVDAVADFDRVLSENELERENQVPMVRVTAGVSQRDLGSASAAVRAAMAKLQLPPGVRIELDGQQKGQAQQFERLLVVALLGIGLVFLLLVVQFRSLRLPVAIFLALPFGQLGALLALQVCGIALNVSSAMGLVLLVGLLVKNGIILIECAQDLAAQGMEEAAALTEAARLRLRPILMTTLAAIAGLLPLAVGLGAGAELQRPLAVAVIGGLMVATIATLFVVPMGCAWLARGRLAREVSHAR